MQNDLKDMPDEFWKKKLSPEQYRALREAVTEPPFSGKYVDNHESGMYHCAGCTTPLFSSETKFESDSGWPSFYQSVDEGKVELHQDNSHGMLRTEVICATCGGHLGHLFEDASDTPTGNRFCINSCSLDFKSKE